MEQGRKAEHQPNVYESGALRRSAPYRAGMVMRDEHRAGASYTGRSARFPVRIRDRA
jgi:hypothetical protein